MKFIICKTSDSFRPEEEPIKGCAKEYTKNGDWYYTKEINSIEKLIELCDVAGEIVINNNDYFYKKPKTEIYDAHRE